MSRILVLDSGPLGLVTHPQRNQEVIAFGEWMSGCFGQGNRVVVPAIVYYEIKRELLRADKIASVAKLDEFVTAAAGRYVELSDAALRLAAELWAQSRRQRRPTAESSR